MESVHLIGALAVIVASLICLSSFIVAKKPEAKQLFEKIAPYQGFLGVGMLALGLWRFIADVGDYGMMLDSPFKLLAISIIAYELSLIVLGFILGFGLIAGWIPGESGAEKKGLEIQKKLLAFSLPIGVIGLIAGVMMLYYYFTWPPS